MIRIEMLCALFFVTGMHPVLDAQTIPSRRFAINEIMYAPSAGGPEWIELENNSNIALSLRDWSVSDAATESKHTLTILPFLIPSTGFVILTKDTLALKDIYPQIPCPIIQVQGFPSLNNSGDAVVLFDQNGTTVDSVRYFPDWGGSGGNSLERRNPEGISGMRSNWAECLDSSGGTPGRGNSTRSLDRDLAMVNVKPRFAVDQLIVIGTILNVGLTPVAGFRVSLIVFAKEITSTLTSALQPGDSDVVQVECSALGTGIVEGIMVVNDPSDQQQANNSQSFRVAIPVKPGALIVNEIMFHPFQNASEYVELFNPGSDAVDIRGWMIHDGSSNAESNRRGAFPDRVHTVPSNGFLLITSDTGFCAWYEQHYTSDCPDVILLPGAFVLNDDEDRIVVHDASGSIVDSLTYRSAWHNPAVASAIGRSLERTNPGGLSSDSRNWTTCTGREGGTPGKINSIYAPSAPAQAGIRCSPNPFSPDGDGTDDVMLVQYSIPLRVATISISIYDVRGRRIRRLADHDPGSVSGVVPWDGRRDDGVRAPVGMYIIMLQATQNDGGPMYEARCIAVLALPL